ncbi:hypothetical protein NRB16_07820 [Pseudomonas sp. LJDD11]|uniref:hypothetical protein n=1 Tax=Pseudomonas sp. LJDD11 TaxID=2931984 RepID=UPI00211BB22B|nr:hypothetical protein [Pseudomonas sp. LJDD11]MCQ9423427.1 hypothetical protein [Pseudomonas sp. LJDD11]
MNPIAQQALANARMVMTSVPCAGACRPIATKPATPATKQPVYATPAPVYASTPPVYAPPAGQLDRFHVMRGRQAAIEFIESCPAQLLATWGVADLIRRMEASLANKPASFAYGFNQVLDLLRVEQLKVAAKPQAL